MPSNSKNLAELLNTDTSIEVGDVANGAITSAKLDTNIAVAGNLTVDTNTLHVDSSNNRVGVGTLTPSDPLVVQKDSSGVQAMLVLKNDDVTADNGITLDFSGKDTGNNNITYASIKATYKNHATEKADINILRRNDSGALTSAVEFNKDGFCTLEGGIAFNGNTAAANQLDDYEEGVYTPTLTGSTSGSATLRSGYDFLAYTKIGRLVTVTGRWETTGGHNMVGNVIFSLPFAQSGSLSAQAETGAGTISLNRTGTNFDSTNLFQTVTFQGESQFYIYYQPSGTGNEALVQGSQLDSAFEGYVNHTFLAENQ